MQASLLDRNGLDRLVAALISRGYRVVAPTVRDGAIVPAEIASGRELPDGWGVEVGPGHYRLRPRTDRAVFGHCAGPQSWKGFLHPPARVLWSTDGREFATPAEDPPAYAFLGVRACDLAAISALTRVLAGGAHPDPAFAARRARLFVVAVACTEPGELCFCASVGTGPEPGTGYDLSLVERAGAEPSSFLVTAGTDRGAEVLAELPRADASGDDVAQAQAAVKAAGARMGRRLPETDVPALLRANRESPVWDEVAARCLTCGNCTMVCPTCFCTTVQDHTELASDRAERTQRWASCFEVDFSYLHGGSVRTSGASRYRQWITHKLSSWQDQFGAGGCVGCGRCTAWCPVGIDITEEAARLADVSGKAPADD